ncbi:MAG: hypothetical protein ACK48X_10670, partial [Planctomycetota bacterium]
MPALSASNPSQWIVALLIAIMLSQGENLGELSLDSIRRLNPFFGPGVKTAVPIVRNVCMSTISETASPPRLLGG